MTTYVVSYELSTKQAGTAKLCRWGGGNYMSLSLSLALSLGLRILVVKWLGSSIGSLPKISNSYNGHQDIRISNLGSRVQGNTNWHVRYVPKSRRTRVFHIKRLQEKGYPVTPNLWNPRLSWRPIPVQLQTPCHRPLLSSDPILII